jgi:hypothetical protein
MLEMLSFLIFIAVILMIVFIKKYRKTREKRFLNGVFGSLAVLVVSFVIFGAVYDPVDEMAVALTPETSKTTTVSQAEFIENETPLITAKSSNDIALEKSESKTSVEENTVTTVEETSIATVSETIAEIETKTETPVETIATTVTVSNKNGDTIVYITDTGEKYHENGCRHLDDSQYAIKLSDAVAGGYAPCGTCKPPELE